MGEVRMGISAGKPSVLAIVLLISTFAVVCGKDGGRSAGAVGMVAAPNAGCAGRIFTIKLPTGELEGAAAPLRVAYRTDEMSGIYELQATSGEKMLGSVEAELLDYVWAQSGRSLVFSTTAVYLGEPGIYKWDLSADGSLDTLVHGRDFGLDTVDVMTFCISRWCPENGQLTFRIELPGMEDTQGNQVVPDTSIAGQVQLPAGGVVPSPLPPKHSDGTD